MKKTIKKIDWWLSPARRYHYPDLDLHVEELLKQVPPNITVYIKRLIMRNFYV